MNNREYPKYPLCGVGAFVIGPKGILMGRRDKDPGKGLWSVPGGVVELGETQADAVKREVLEETGVHIEVLRLLDTRDLIIHDDEGKIRFHYILNYFLARPLDMETKAETPTGEVGWFKFEELPKDEMPELLWEAMLQLREIIERMTKGE